MNVIDKVKNFLEFFDYEQENYEEALDEFCYENGCTWDIVGWEIQYLIIAYPSPYCIDILIRTKEIKNELSKR